MWYSNTLQFPFQEIYIKSMHKSALISFDSEGSACNIRTWSGKTSEDGLSRIRTWVYGSIRRTCVQKQKHWSSHGITLRSTSRSEDKKMLCTKLFDSDDIQTLYTQTSDHKKVQVAGYAD